MGDELLAVLRAHLRSDVGFAQAPTQLGGGFYTANYRFSLTGAPPEWCGPLVLRLFPTHAPEGLDDWEAAVQTLAHDGGVPAPAVRLRGLDVPIEGRRWFVMDMLPGTPALADVRLQDLIGGARRLIRDVPRQTAAVHLELHRLDPKPLLARFADSATVDRWLDRIPVVDADGRAHPLAPAVDWLTRNRPRPRTFALCHGDSWGGNLLVSDGQVSGLIDWSVATVAEPAFEIGFLTTLLSLAPVPLPPAIRRVIQLFGGTVANRYRAAYAAMSDADLTSVPYYQALRCLVELTGVVNYRMTLARGQVFDGPRPAWDYNAEQMARYFERRTGVQLALPSRATIGPATQENST